MKIAFLPFVSFMLVSATVVAQGDFEEGLRWYSQRSSGSVGIQAKPEHINKAIPYFIKALENGNKELDAAIYLMRSYNFKARFVLENTGEKRRTYELAKEVGDQMVPKYPLSKELRFEYLSSLGQWGEVMGVIRAATEGIVNKVKEQMEALVKLDPEFRNAVGERSLAVLNIRVPKIPFILSWPDKKKALVMTADVLRRYPDDMGNNFYHAEALVKNGKEEEAVSYLLRALSMQPNPDFLLEDLHFHVEAKRMLERIQGQ